MKNPDTFLSLNADDPSMTITPGIMGGDEPGISPALTLPQNTAIPGDLGINAGTPIVEPADLPGDPIVYDYANIVPNKETAVATTETINTLNTMANVAATAQSQVLNVNGNTGIVSDDVDIVTPETNGQRALFIGIIIALVILAVIAAKYLVKAK